MADAPKLPEWFGNAAIEAAYDQYGNIIGITLRCLIEHDKLTLLPDLLMEAAHDVIDRAAAKDASRRG